MAATKTTLILKASDDGQYTVEKSVAEKSGLIKMMIEGECEILLWMMLVLLEGWVGWTVRKDVWEAEGGLRKSYASNRCPFATSSAMIAARLISCNLHTISGLHGLHSLASGCLGCSTS
jgi:hypothetical protein